MANVEGVDGVTIPEVITPSAYDHTAPTTEGGTRTDPVQTTTATTSPTTTDTSPASSVTTPYDGPGKDYNDADPNARFLGLGGHPEVWKDSTTGQMFIVHFASGTEPPVPLLYEVPDQDTLQAFFGEGVTIVFDRTLTTADMNSTGSVRFGTTNNLPASEGDPWLGFLDRIERLREVSPWVDDDEILALVGGAYLEGRDIEDWELQTTAWWREHTAEERAWLELSMGDPSAAVRKLEDDQIYASSLFDKIGAEGNDPAMIEWMSKKFTTGEWSEAFLVTQVEAVTSGYGEVDDDLRLWMMETGVDAQTSQQNFDRVKDLWRAWLGPAYPPSEAQVTEWATKLRTSGDGEESLVELLRGQRMALFPEYEDASLRYADIAGPWKSMAYNVWGVEADETDPRFQEIVRMNNATEAAKEMRQIGIDEGYERVLTSMTNAADAGMRRGVRGAV